MESRDSNPNPDFSISVAALAEARLRGRFPLVIDVRRAPRYAEGTAVIRGALRRDPDSVGQWRPLPPQRPIIVYCVHGHEVSQNTAAALRAAGLDARYLVGGFVAWQEAGFPLGPKPSATPGQWITRARPKIDRIACPWLVRRFIDPEATFLYVPAEQVLPESQRLGATPYDIPDVDYSHVGELCSFDAFIARHALGDDPALQRLSLIVRGADTGRPELAPESAGLLSVSLGLSAIYDDDHAMLEAAMPVYDALYARAAAAADESHSWQPRMTA